ncbi:hypothetical protein Tco_1046969 [Tanacetum coccineum]
MITSPYTRAIFTIRITSSPSLSSNLPLHQPFEPQPSPDQKYLVPTPNDTPLSSLLPLTSRLVKLGKKQRFACQRKKMNDSSKQGRIDEDPNTYFAQDDKVVSRQRYCAGKTNQKIVRWNYN